MVDLKDFKKIVENCLSNAGFLKKSNFYYRSSDELILVVGLQKSNYSNGYYINIGYVIPQLNPNLVFPKDVDGDIRARFTIESDGKRIDFFELDKITDETLLHSMQVNIERYVVGVVSISDLKSLLEKNPVMLYQTKLLAKKFLKLE